MPANFKDGTQIKSRYRGDVFARQVRTVSQKFGWIVKAFLTVFSGFITPREASIFVLSRVSPARFSITLHSVHFGKIDLGLWRQLFHIFLRREYSPAGFEIGEDDLVIDIGANRGVFTTFAASQTSAPVYAYEPDPTNYSHLVEVVHKNKFSNVYIHQAAVSASNGTLKLFLADADTRHSLTGVDVLTGENLENFVNVLSVNLDTMLVDLDEVDLLKVDCEGAEFGIFEAANAASLQKIRRIILEFHSRRDDPRMESLLNLLSQSGFQFIKVAPTSSSRGMVFAKKND